LLTTRRPVSTGRRGAAGAPPPPPIYYEAPGVGGVAATAAMLAAARIGPKADGKAMNCAVCHEEVAKGEGGKPTGCTHVGHLKCLHEWAAAQPNPTCAECRFTVDALVPVDPATGEATGDPVPPVIPVVENHTNIGDELWRRLTQRVAFDQPFIDEMAATVDRGFLRITATFDNQEDDDDDEPTAVVLTPLQFAVRLILPRHVVVLIEQGADASVTYDDGDGELPLHVAIQVGLYPEIIRKIIEAYPAAVNISDRDGAHPLHYIVRRQNQALASHIVFTLIANDADRNAISPLLGTPLEIAAYRDKIVMLGALLEANVNPNRDIAPYGGAPIYLLHDLIENEGSSRIIQALLDHGASVTAVNPNGFTALQLAKTALDRAGMYIFRAAARQAVYDMVKVATEAELRKRARDGDDGDGDNRQGEEQRRRLQSRVD
jgi:ankyrin repeat protein